MPIEFYNPSDTTLHGAWEGVSGKRQTVADLPTVILDVFKNGKLIQLTLLSADAREIAKRLIEESNKAETLYETLLRAWANE